MYLIKKIGLITVLQAILATAAIAQEKSDKVIPTTKWTLGAGFNLAGLSNYGFEVTGNYAAFQNSWLRMGPTVQAMYFFSPQLPYGENEGNGLISEVHLNAMPEFEFKPFKKNSFFISIAPYIGWQMLYTKGTLRNEDLGIDATYKDVAHIFNWGSRYKIGGYFGQKKLNGMDFHFQMSHRGLTDKNVSTKFFMLDYSDYKSFIGFSYLRRF